MPEKDPGYGCRLDGPDAFIDYGEIARKEIEEILKANPDLDINERRRTAPARDYKKTNKHKKAKEINEQKEAESGNDAYHGKSIV